MVFGYYFRLMVFSARVWLGKHKQKSAGLEKKAFSPGGSFRQLEIVCWHSFAPSQRANRGKVQPKDDICIPLTTPVPSCVVHVLICRQTNHQVTPVGRA